MHKRYFGTDGIRGKVGTSPITADFMLKLGWAVGRVLVSAEDEGSVLIGKDTRISGYMLESALQAGLSGAGVDIRLLGPIPTPAVAYLTKTLHAAAGIVISASHNPCRDNGVKFFTSAGDKLPETAELTIEQALQAPMQMVQSARLGKAYRVHDARGRYIEFCKSTIRIATELHGIKMVVDCAHGATYKVAPSVFRELGAQVIAIGVHPDGLNINDSGAANPKALRQAVLKHHADIGVGFDGDGDRVVTVDHKGELVDGDEMLFILAKSRLDRGLSVGGVVGTTLSNLGLGEALAKIGVEFEATEVGDRHVQKILDERGWVLGGESSGHIICKDKTSTGDGIVAALQVLEAIVTSGSTLHDLKQGISKYPQCQAVVNIPPGLDITNAPRLRELLQRVQHKLTGRGRALLRPSGTEAVVRVLVESRNKKDIQRYVPLLTSEVERAIRR